MHQNVGYKSTQVGTIERDTRRSPESRLLTGKDEEELSDTLVRDGKEMGFRMFLELVSLLPRILVHSTGVE